MTPCLNQDLQDSRIFWMEPLSASGFTGFKDFLDGTLV